MPAFKVQIYATCEYKKRTDLAQKCFACKQISMLTIFLNFFVHNVNYVLFYLFVRKYIYFKYVVHNGTGIGSTQLSKLNCSLRYLRKCRKLQTQRSSSSFLLFHSPLSLSRIPSESVCVLAPFRVIRCAPACVHHLSC